jgi:heme O synthase-like polyprenyltransferase
LATLTNGRNTPIERVQCGARAAGRLRPVTALWFGVSLSVVGVVYLLVAVNDLRAMLSP